MHIHSCHYQDAEELFIQAWNTPSFTQIELKNIDINQVLHEQYQTQKPLSLTRGDVWKAEQLKAENPLKYIPHVVRRAESFGKKVVDNGLFFLRSSQQRQWLQPDTFGDVFERVYVNQVDQRITFIGVRYLVQDSGQLTEASNEQPLFFVQHSVSGEDHNPINVWKIVHLTDSKDSELIEKFKLFPSNILPSFVEIYLKEDLNITLDKKTS